MSLLLKYEIVFYTYPFFSIISWSCSDDLGMPINGIIEVDSSGIDQLIATDILGTWALEKTLVNNITDLTIQCCDTLFLNQSGIASDLVSDLVGSFMRKSNNFETSGTFELDEDNETISFVFDDTELNYEYGIQGNSLSFIYTVDTASVQEQWTREEATD